MKFYLKIAAGFLLLLAVFVFMVWYRTSALGHDALRDIATQAQLCKTVGCSEGIDEAASYLAEQYGLSPGLVQWCVGVDTLSERDGAKGLVNRSWWINLLYEPCGDPIME